MATAALGAAGEWAARELDGVFEGEAENRFLSQGDQVLFRADAERVWLSIINLSQVSLFVHFGFRGQQFAGIELTARGGAITLSFREDLILPAQEILIQSPQNNVPIYAASMRRFRTHYQPQRG